MILLLQTFGKGENMNSCDISYNIIKCCFILLLMLFKASIIYFILHYTNIFNFKLLNFYDCIILAAAINLLLLEY